MKKTFVLFAALMLAYATSRAQTEKGTQTVGLNIQFDQQISGGATINADGSALSQNSTYKTFNVGPQYSYFIANNLALGALISYSSSSNAYPTSGAGTLDDESQKAYEAAIFLRKYFMYKDKIGLRFGPMIGYTRINGNSSYIETDINQSERTRTDTWNAELTAELVYYPTKHLGFSALLANAGYSYSNSNMGAGGAANTKYTYLNLINNGLDLSVFYSF